MKHDVKETHAPAVLLVVSFLLLGWLAFAAGASGETILLVAGVLVLAFLVFLSGA